MNTVRTNGQNSDFVALCAALDDELNEIIGAEKQSSTYDRYNLLGDIRDAVVVYIDAVPVAGGAFKLYEDGVAEIKRVFVKRAYRGRGLSKTVMHELETMAAEAGYRRLVLETGRLLAAAQGLYASLGYTVIDNYGPYVNMAESVCMEKILISQ